MKVDGLKTAEMNLRSMSVKTLSVLTAFLLLFQIGAAAPAYSQQGRAAPRVDSLPATVQQIRITLSELTHQVRNHEGEIRTFENKLQSQEASFDQLRQELSSDMQSQKDFSKTTLINLQAKTEALEQSQRTLDSVTRGLTSDIKQIKGQANETVSVLSQYKQKITELENLIAAQNEHMNNLEVAIRSLMEAWQIKEKPRQTSNKTEGETISYKVQPGDTLEKIAKNQKTSIQAIREANQLTNDRIVSGQILKIR